MNLFRESLNTPWKAVNELLMFILKPIAYFYIRILNGTKLGKGYKFYGLPRIFRHKDSQITIGQRFENRNIWDSNPLGINHATIICTWREKAEIKIGNDVGISGGSVVACKRVEIGDGTIVGTNTLIIDSDFHPIRSFNRRYDLRGVRTSPVKIGKNVFIGVGCIILKGSKIPDNSVIPAGSVVRSKTRFSKGY